MNLTKKKIIELILRVFPDNTVNSFIIKGYWVKDEKSSFRGNYIIFFTLNSNKSYCMKIVTNINDLEDYFMGELGAISLLRKHNFSVPNIVHVDYSKKEFEYPFYILDKLEGIKLATLWIQESEDIKRHLYYVLGNYFCKMHSIHHTISGLFTQDPYITRYPDMNPTISIYFYSCIIFNKLSMLKGFSMIPLIPSSFISISNSSFEKPVIK